MFLLCGSDESVHMFCEVGRLGGAILGSFASSQCEKSTVTARVYESYVQKLVIINNSSLVIYLYWFLGQDSSKV